MKKILLFAILALSVNALAQTNHSASRSNKNALGRMENIGRRTPNSQSEMNLGQISTHNIIEQPSLIQLFDSTYIWEWDTISNGWNLEYKDIAFVYDAHRNLTSYIDQHWYDNIWQNNTQYISTFDGNDNQTSFKVKFWNGTLWENYSQYLYSYDANNNLTSQIMQTWNINVWVNSYQYIYTYDDKNNQTSQVRQGWNDSIWVNTWQNIYTYDASNNQTNGLSQSN